MADFDKDSIVNLLSGLLGEDKKDSVASVIESVSAAMPTGEQGNSTVKNNDSLFDTTAVMSQVGNIMGKINSAKNGREYNLLTAIRPYMRQERQPRIDSCMKILQVVSIIGEFKGKK